MFLNADKRKLYQLISMYLSGFIDEISFCDDFYPLYNVSVDLDTLKEEEYRAFSELNKIISRFSEFERDHKENPGVFYTKEDVKLKIQETRKKLSKYFDELEQKGELD